MKHSLNYLDCETNPYLASISLVVLIKKKKNEFTGAYTKKTWVSLAKLTSTFTDEKLLCACTYSVFLLSFLLKVTKNKCYRKKINSTKIQFVYVLKDANSFFLDSVI